jgi:hypothetical protein
MSADPRLTPLRDFCIHVAGVFVSMLIAGIMLALLLAPVVFLARWVFR